MVNKQLLDLVFHFCLFIVFVVRRFIVASKALCVTSRATPFPMQPFQWRGLTMTSQQVSVLSPYELLPRLMSRYVCNVCMFFFFSQRWRLLAPAGSRKLQGCCICSRISDCHQEGCCSLQPRNQGRNTRRIQRATCCTFVYKIEFHTVAFTL